MPDEISPSAPPASSAPIPPAAAPTPAAKEVRKHHIGLVLGGVLVLFLLMHMMSGSSSSSSTAADGSVPAAAASSTNPLIGSWTLEASEADKTYCNTHEQFTNEAVIDTKAGVATSYAATYLIKPTYVDVAENGDLAHYGEWDLTSPDEINFRLNSLYVASSCLYHRD